VAAGKWLKYSELITSTSHNHSFIHAVNRPTEHLPQLGPGLCAGNTSVLKADALLALRKLATELRAQTVNE